MILNDHKSSQMPCFDCTRLEVRSYSSRVASKISQDHCHAHVFFLKYVTWKYMKSTMFWFFTNPGSYNLIFNAVLDQPDQRFSQKDTKRPFAAPSRPSSPLNPKFAPWAMAAMTINHSHFPVPWTLVFVEAAPGVCSPGIKNNQQESAKSKVISYAYNFHMQHAFEMT